MSEAKCVHRYVCRFVKGDCRSECGYYTAEALNPSHNTQSAAELESMRKRTAQIAAQMDERIADIMQRKFDIVSVESVIDWARQLRAL